MSSTTSIRLPDNLRIELEIASKQMHRGKNWLITQALKEYLNSFKDASLREEAKRQSLLVSKTDQSDTFWEDIADTQGWV